MSSEIPASTTADRNVVRPQTLLVDTPTFHHLAFRWLIQGDDNRDSSVEVSYRRAEDSEWLPALPLEFMLDFQGTRLFAGSVLNLQPGTTYDIRIDLSDPDGGDTSKIVTVSTRRPLPARPPVLRTAHVYPVARPNGSLGGVFEDFRAALQQARPGDLVLLHAGTYTGPFETGSGGTFDLPIVFRNAGDGEVILENPDGNLEPVLTGARDTNHLYFEGLTFRQKASRGAIVGGTTSGWVIRGCLVLGGISTGRTNWTVTDNVLVGRYDQWRLRRRVPAGTGVRIFGTGHVVRRNRISYFWDGISTHILDREVSWSFSEHGPQHANDIEDNLIFAIADDGIEVDAVNCNVRVIHNRVMSTAMGISLQDTVPGPVYVIRNEVTNLRNNAWKIFGATTGLRLFHNTSISLVYPWQPLSAESGIWNSVFWNNLFLSRAGPFAFRAGTGSRFDHNGYVERDGAKTLARWTPDAGASWREFRTLGELAATSGQEAHGLSIDESRDLVGPVRFDVDRDYQPADMNLAPSPEGVLIDSGRHIPTVNDSYTGEAPDIGALEAGVSGAGYGPLGPVGLAYVVSAALPHHAGTPHLTTQPIGFWPLTMKERIILFLDVHNISVWEISAYSVLFGVLLGIALTLLWSRWARKPTASGS